MSDLSLNGAALRWWRSLSRNEQFAVFSQSPRSDQNWTFAMFAASTREIVKMYVTLGKPEPK